MRREMVFYFVLMIVRAVQFGIAYALGRDTIAFFCAIMFLCDCVMFQRMRRKVKEEVR
jgi:hypothetical protein